MNMSVDNTTSISMNPQIRALRELAPEIPTNEYGLVTGFYRPDFLPNEILDIPEVSEIPQETASIDQPEEESTNLEGSTESTNSTNSTESTVIIPFPNDSEKKKEDSKPPAATLLIGSQDKSKSKSVTKGLSPEQLEAAWTPLSYDGGYPILPCGTAFWGQLDYESPEAFQIFTAFLQMPTLTGTGTRVLSELSVILSKEASAKIPTEMLQGYCHLYYWNQRVAAYDLFKVAAHRKELELRAIETQDDHYQVSTKLLGRLHEFMDGDADFWDLMTPKVAIDFQKNLIQMQRISAGLPGAAPLREEERGGDSIEVTMRQIGGKNQQNKVANDDDQEILLDKVLEDETMAEMAQELVIKLNKVGH